MTEITAPRVAPPSLRPAPATLTPVAVDALIAVADRMRGGTADGARAYRGPYPILTHRTVAGSR